MLNRIIEFSIKNKLIIGLLVIALIATGIYQTSKLPIDAVPDITNNQVQVITVAPSFSATDIERFVTFPVEQANSNIAGIKEIRSFSRFGLSLVTIVFNDNVDVYWARQQVTEKLQQIQSQIPAGIGTPQLGPITTGLGEIYQYVVRPKKGFEKKYDVIALRTIQDWIVRRQLLGVKGVADVSSFGGKLKQYEISVNPNKLNAYGITITDIFNALENNNQNTGGAYIEKGPTVLFIRTEGLLKSIDDIKNISINKPNATLPLFIRDVADVNISYATRYGAMCYNDEGEVSGAIVMMLKGANSSEVIKNVKERVAQIQKTLPEGVVIEPFLDRTKMVNHAIGTVEKNLVEGALIVVFVLVVFLGNLRAGLLVASVIPLSMLFAICMMNLFGVSGNLMSLGALDFGLIVDGAVIIVEAVMHILHNNQKIYKHNIISQQKMNVLVETSAKKMMNSAVFGQIIILVVYLPIFTLQGIEGKMFKPMAQTVSFALLGAFILSLTYIPMMSSLVLSKKYKHKINLSEKIMLQLEYLFAKKLAFVLKHPKTVLTSVFILFVGSIILLTRLGGEFIPALEEGDFAVDTKVLTGSNLTTTIAYTQKAAHILKTQFPEVEKVVTKIGSGEIPTDPMPMEASDMMVILKDKKEWKSAKTFTELENKMSAALHNVAGITTSFQFPVQMRFNELMTGARQDIVCKIFGENLDTLANYATQLGKIISTVKGASNLYIEPIKGMPQVVIEYNRPTIAQYHLSISDINKIINSSFAGQSTGLFFEDEKRFDVVVRLNGNDKKNIDDIKNLLVPVSNGMQIPLYQLANINIKNDVNQIQREDAKRRIIVGFNVSGRDIQSIVEELQQKTNKQLKFPAGYYVTYGGAFENLVQAKNRLMIAVPISLILIFILLFFAFKNIKQGLLIYTAIPLSAIGGILFLVLRGMPFSISAGVGFIALFGVSVLNGIVLVAEFNRLKKIGIQSLSFIVIKGTKLRLRPVLMTASVASLGFLPMAISNGAGAEVQRPLATVVIGGLLIATLLTLFVLPLLYILFEKGIKLNKMKRKSVTAIIVALFFTQNIHAQNSINLNQAVDSAVINNNRIKNEMLKEAYAKSLIQTSADIPKTNLFSEWGQINSPLFDYKFSINQTIQFPTVYKKQKEVLTAEYGSAILNKQLKIYELKKAVTQCYYVHQSLKAKENLLLKADSLYTLFYNKALLRLQKGESNVLEKTTAENQKASIQLQLNQIHQEIESNLLLFQYLINNNNCIPQYENNLNKIKAVIDTSNFKNHPLLQLLNQQIIIEQRKTDLEKAKLNPDINFGVNATTFSGSAADNNIYTTANRFASVQIGVGIPIFTQSQKAKIKSSKTAQLIAANESANTQQELQINMKRLLTAYANNNVSLKYFETTGLKNAATISNTADKQFTTGEINYLDFVILLNQSIAIESGYIEAIQNHNNIVVEINFILK